jgi:fido (protein-threonine AMPylation protein)
LATPWNDDPAASLAVIEQNIRSLVPLLQQQARSRVVPSVAIAQDWHRAIYASVPLPVSYYAGEIRDSDDRFPELIGYEVRIGPHRGVPSANVPAQLSLFEGALQQTCATLDAVVAPGSRPDSQADVLSVVQLAAIVHGEWVSIHPFANGNGRTARLWGNWIAMRYELPPSVTIKARPAGLLYAGAAAQSMSGDHSAMVVVFHDLLRQKLAGR